MKFKHSSIHRSLKYIAITVELEYITVIELPAFKIATNTCRCTIKLCRMLSVYCDCMKYVRGIQ